MKKAILAPLCSALIIPGLGQVINRHLKKGVMLLGSTFLLFLLGLVELYRTLAETLEEAPPVAGDPQALAKALMSRDLGMLWIVLCLFSVLWVYSVVDAFLAGRKTDRSGVPAKP